MTVQELRKLKVGSLIRWRRFMPNDYELGTVVRFHAPMHISVMMHQGDHKNSVVQFRGFDFDNIELVRAYNIKS